MKRAAVPLSLLLFFQANTQGQIPMPLGDIVALIEQNVAPIQDLSLQYEFTEKWMDAQKPEGSSIYPSRVNWGYVKNGDRQIFEVMAFKDNSLKDLVSRLTYSWDGTQSYFWRQDIDPQKGKEIGPDGLPDDVGSGGISGKKQLPQFGPLDFLSHDQKTPFVKVLTDPKCNLTVEDINDTVNGRPAIRVGSAGQKIWFDRERGALLKSAIYLEGELDVPFMSYEVLESGQFGPVWLPVQAKFTQRNNGGKGSFEALVKINPDTVKINQGEDKYNFKVEFAPGTAVMDTVKKTMYNIPVPAHLGKKGSNISTEQKLELLLDKSDRQIDALPKDNK